MNYVYLVTDGTQSSSKQDIIHLFRTKALAKAWIKQRNENPKPGQDLLHPEGIIKIDLSRKKESVQLVNISGS